MSVLELRRPAAAEAALPRWPRAWYVVARSSDLRPGALITGRLAGREYVVFRTRGSALAALDAHCPHMGAHLRAATVVGERLRCPLHHWTLGGDGDCRGPGAGEVHRSRPWPIAERYGLVFLYPAGGPAEPPPLPGPASPGDWAWTTGRPVFLATDWHSMMVNGFDLLHLRSVHHRELVEPHELTRLGGGLRLRYVSRVTSDGGYADRVMKRVSGDRIRVSQVCYGPTMVVESDLGRTRSVAVLGLTTEDGGVRAFGAFATPRGGLTERLRLALSRWLFTAFLRRDFAVVEGMRLKLEGVDDPGVRALGAFLRSLPEAEEA
jgi:nitrite reductase/ring-hydroxylating ferredoxin subunit